MGIFNLFKKNKSNNDPYWEFDQTTHYRPKLNKVDFFKLTGFDFGWFVLEPISEFIQNQEGELTKGKNLSYGQKALYYWWYVDAQVTNGGFTQFYFNDYGKYVPTIIKALQHIGDNEMADLVAHSYTLYLKESNKIKDARTGDWEDFSNLYQEIEDFDELDDEYYDLHHQTMKKIANYVRKKPTEFCLDEEGKEFDLSFSGDQKTYYSSDKLKEIIPFSKGVVSGTFQSFYENGNPKEFIQYENGEQTGEREEFYENGNKQYTVKMLPDKKLVEHLWYYENGNPKRLEHKRLEKDERFGEYKEWYDNGQLEETGTYISNQDREGEFLEYHKNGNPRIEAVFKNRKIVFINCWLEDKTQTMKDGTGLHVYDYLSYSGELRHGENEYKDSKRHGKQQTYTNGILTFYQEMENGIENGVARFFHKDGSLKKESIYENGVEKSSREFNS